VARGWWANGPIAYIRPGVMPKGSRVFKSDQTGRKLRTADGNPTRSRLYDRQWQAARLAFLSANPWCVHCRRAGWYVAADVVDHIEPHKGDPGLFWDSNNWQPLCKHHHQVTKARMERGQPRTGFAPDGTPLDKDHRWNA